MIQLDTQSSFRAIGLHRRRQTVRGVKTQGAVLHQAARGGLRLYVFLSGVREMERACRENINFMWLLEGYPAPAYNTIARFIAAVDMNAVLVKVNNLLMDKKEIRFENAFIDGTKLEANAGKYSFV